VTKKCSVKVAVVVSGFARLARSGSRQGLVGLRKYSDSKRTGEIMRKFLYGMAMFLSGLTLVLSVAGIAGLWVAERALANSVVEILGVAKNATSGLLQTTQGIDQKLEQIQTLSTQVSTGSAQLSQNLTDKGMILVLLPEEQDQKLVELSASDRETFNTLRDKLTTGMALYHAIDQLPFINLPAPNQEQVDQFEGSVAGIQSAVEDLHTDIAAFRSGVADRIGKVETGADSLTSLLGQSRERLANLNTRLAAVQEALIQLQQTAVVVLFWVTFLISLLLVWVIFSQVEVFRLYRQRWIGARTEKPTNEFTVPTSGVESESPVEPGGHPEK
jgi:hypothetical protein